MLTILEANGEGDTGREFTMELRLSGTSTDSTPRDEIGDVLGRDGVEELGSDRDTNVGEIAQELTSKAQSLVDLERPVEIWVIDETLPSDGSAWFLFKSQLPYSNAGCATYFTVNGMSQEWVKVTRRSRVLTSKPS